MDLLDDCVSGFSTPAAETLLQAQVRVCGPNPRVCEDGCLCGTLSCPVECTQGQTACLARLFLELLHHRSCIQRAGSTSPFTTHSQRCDGAQ